MGGQVDAAATSLTLTYKVESLVQYLSRRGRIPHLVPILKRDRPHAPWPDI
ncbi:MAG: hypothetical protein KJ063_00390 [Anaerolineae bacterium]|nr:hypothetical protein [Anaerolineae bacterium]